MNWPTDYLNKVICGDCLEIMKGIPDKSVDLVLTDPPYDKETHAGGMFTGDIKFGNVSFAPLTGFDFVTELLRISKAWVLVFTSIECLGEIRKTFSAEYIRGGIWDRVVNSPQISGDRPAQAVEGIAILHSPGKKNWNGGGSAGIWRWAVERGHKEHETQKPLSLFKELMRQFSNRGDLILDPFFGSGTTGVAAKLLGRQFIGIEISEKYCEIAKQRIDGTVVNKKLEFK